MNPELDLSQVDEARLWRHVGSHLARSGFSPILVGGAAVAIHSGGVYRSYDLDVLLEPGGSQSLPETMAEIGFTFDRGYYRHPGCPFLIEFVAGPLGIGESYQVELTTWDEAGTPVRLLSPTDSVCDRLAGYIHFEARECLDQAALIAKACPIDWQRVERWSTGEGAGASDALDALRCLLKD